MPAAAVASTSVRLVLLGLDPHTASQIVNATPGHAPLIRQHLPVTDGECHQLLRDSGGSLLFCPAEFPLLSRLIAAARRYHAQVVVVAQHPSEEQWLDALEAGASDYIAPPFDIPQMDWLLKGCQHSRVAAAAAQAL